MRKIIEYIILAFALLLASISAAAQTDRREVRSGNRQFRKENFTRAEIDYRKALVKDSSSFAASYDLANSLYRQNNFEEAGKTLEKVKDIAPMSPNSSDYYYNLGNVACQKKDWQAAVDAYKQSLLRNPADMDAKENYIYAKLMLKNQGGGGKDKNNQNQDQDQQNQNQNQQNQISRTKIRTRISKPRTRIRTRISRISSRASKGRAKFLLSRLSRCSAPFRRRKRRPRTRSIKKKPHCLNLNRRKRIGRSL